jgi:hypothetical protein
MSRGVDEPWQTGADLVIVGAGLAGLALAAELEAATGQAPLVIEAGPDRGLDHYRHVLDDREAQAYWLTPEVDPDFWRPYEQAGDSFGGIAGLRRRVGGRSLYWHGVTLPMDPWALRSDVWPTAVRDSLLTGWENGPSLYERTMAELKLWCRRPTLGGSHTASLGGYRLSQTPLAIRPEPGGRSRIYSPAERWRESGRALPVVTGCRVLGLLARDRRLTGLRVRRGELTTDIRAATVVLAAGTVENSRLAIQLLRETGRLGQPRLTGLADKIASGFTLVLRPADVPNWLTDAAAHQRFFMAPADDQLRSNLFARTFVSDSGSPGIDIWLMGEQRAGADGFVHCDEATPWPWRTRVGCSLSPLDTELAAAQRAELARVHAALSTVTGTPLAPLRFDAGFGSPDLSQRLMRAQTMEPGDPATTYSFPLGSEQHESGTLRMGELTDADQRVLGVDGLFAAGPCVFPRAGAANPALTILALAKRLAHTLTRLRTRRFHGDTIRRARPGDRRRDRRRGRRSRSSGQALPPAAHRDRCGHGG